MVSLRWGDVLSTLLPGSVALFAVSPHIPVVAARLENLNEIGIGAGFALLIAAALMGGLLEAFTRVTWERWVLQRFCKSPDALSNLRDEPQKVDLYERGVQNSYKYSTFYANFAWAILLLPAARLELRFTDLFIMLAAAILLYASYIQWTYFVNYLDRIFGETADDAEG